MSFPRVTGPSGRPLVGVSPGPSQGAPERARVPNPAATVFESAPSFGIFEHLDPSRAAARPLSGFWSQFPGRSAGPVYRVLQLDAVEPLFAEVGLPAPRPDAVDGAPPGGEGSDAGESFFRLLGFESSRAAGLRRRHALVPTLADQQPRLALQTRALEAARGERLGDFESPTLDRHRMPFLSSLAFLRALGHRWSDGLRALQRMFG